jgi:hypothetical protein
MVILRSGPRAWALALLAVWVIPSWTLAQPYQQRYPRGQNVVPVFQGWQRNADATFTMVFGYLNRNYEEELLIPIGPMNKLEPGDADWGQPNQFVPRSLPLAFQVIVPSDWGKKELVWTLTAHGRTEKAIGTLSRVWEMDPSTEPGAQTTNTPPEVSFEQAFDKATVGKPLSIKVAVRDDGKPDPRPATATAPGLQALWIPYRGPGRIQFNPKRMMVADGHASTDVTFEMPGEYVVRVLADDGLLTSQADATVRVAPK